jgi:hypothetical protein
LKTTTRSGLAFIALGVAFAMPIAFAAGESHEALMAQAKVTQEQARTTALAKVPNGIIKSEELEMENGRLVWSFDIAQASVKNVTEVWVDAKTGKIVSAKKETLAQEAAEAIAHKKVGK